ncbi:antibiotic biosynthesis monooxygenase [Vibrio clamense]|uniref:putative quinol monooxygenase n=1 Tax=Vibrio clamense TaxID=2910254 RepID=UPI003D19540E
MSKVTLKGFIVVPEQDLEIVKHELENHKMLTLQEPGCLIFKVIQDEVDSTRFDVYEEFVDRKSFESHQNRVRGSHWGEVTSNVERHYEIFE